MEKILILIIAAFVTLQPIRANVEKKLDKVIKEQNIPVTSNTKKNIDSLEKLITKLDTDSLNINDLKPMQPGNNWLKNNWEWLLSLLIFLLEIFLRVAPTNKDWSIINKILSILIWIFNIIPNNAKQRNEIFKRGYNLKIKKVIDNYKNK